MYIEFQTGFVEFDRSGTFEATKYCLSFILCIILTFIMYITLHDDDDDDRVDIVDWNGYEPVRLLC